MRKEIEEIREEDTFSCKDCCKNWHGWAVKDNMGNCPDCQRSLL